MTKVLFNVAPSGALAAVAVIMAMAGNVAAAKPSDTAQTCIAGNGQTQVAITVARPQDCCTGRMACAQYLSTVTVVRPGHDQHT